MGQVRDPMGTNWVVLGQGRQRPCNLRPQQIQTLDRPTEFVYKSQFFTKQCNSDLHCQTLRVKKSFILILFYFFYYYFFINLFYFYFFLAALGLCFLQLQRVGATLRCGARASHGGGFSCCGARALGAPASVVVARGLQSAGSVVVAHGLSCSTACRIFPDQGSNPCALHWQADS